MEFLKTKSDIGYTDTVRAVYRILSGKYGYTARISEIYELLKTAFGITEFSIFDPRYCNNAILESYLIDEYVKWQRGGVVDFGELHKVILKEGDFSESEKSLFVSGNIEERLWAIFLVIGSPELNI